MKSIILNAKQIVTPKGNKAVRGRDMNKLNVIENGAVYMEEGIIKAVGTSNEVLNKVKSLEDVHIIDACKKAVVPGFVDSHTHFIFGGYREDEFINRLKGMPYLEILKRGGGIMSTVTDTRNASENYLYVSGRERLKKMLAQGVTTVEGKSGYGLDFETEVKQLNVMKRLNKTQPVDIVTTYLGAHAVAREFAGRSGEYLDYMQESVMPYVFENGLAEFCDVFCEDSVFSTDESRKLLTKAKEMGFKLKLHADEIVPMGGAELAGAVGAVSADHLLMITEKGIDSIVKNNVVATLLPCTAFCLAKPYAPARNIIDRGGAVALASDLNPGSCFSNSIPLMLSLAVIHMNMTIEEALTAMTLNGAAAVDRADTIGTIEEGKKADILILEYPSYKFLVYNTGANIVNKVIKNGAVVYEN